MGLGSPWDSFSNFVPIPKIRVNVQGNRYVYPEYSTDDLTPQTFPGDRPNVDATAPDPRFSRGPR